MKRLYGNFRREDINFSMSSSRNVLGKFIEILNLFSNFRRVDINSSMSSPRNVLEKFVEKLKFSIVFDEIYVSR